MSRWDEYSIKTVVFVNDLKITNFQFMSLLGAIPVQNDKFAERLERPFFAFEGGEFVHGPC